MQIEVFATGNRGLYRSIYESIDRTTTHRTATGAARALIKLQHDAKDWSRSCGQWGSWGIRIDGRDLTSEEDADLTCQVEMAMEDRRWNNPVNQIAAAIERIAR